LGGANWDLQKYFDRLLSAGKMVIVMERFWPFSEVYTFLNAYQPANGAKRYIRHFERSDKKKVVLWVYIAIDSEEDGLSERLQGMGI